MAPDPVPPKWTYAQCQQGILDLEVFLEVQVGQAPTGAPHTLVLFTVYEALLQDNYSRSERVP